MNDYLEIDYGLECLAVAYKSNHAEIFKSTLDAIHSGICEEVVELFDGWSPRFSRQTYLTCMSEHQDAEDNYGRLSMWRAYGGVTRVAIVLNNTPFLSDSDALGVKTSPVEYLSHSRFQQEFKGIGEAVRTYSDLLKSESRDMLKARIFNMFKFAALCTKHPGFGEEKEWRIIYTDELSRSEKLVRAVKVIGGTPQPVYKIPLVDIPGEGLIDVEVPKILNRIIIGPTEHPIVSRDAFVEVLERSGVENPDEKVFVSDIPLR